MLSAAMIAPWLALLCVLVLTPRAVAQPAEERGEPAAQHGYHWHAGKHRAALHFAGPAAIPRTLS